MRRVTSQLAEVETGIAGMEREMETTGHLLAVPEHLDAGELAAMSGRYRQLQQTLEEAMLRWEQLTMQLENMRNEPV
jgi:hypothetical protein